MTENGTKGGTPLPSLEEVKRRHSDGVRDVELVAGTLMNLNEYLRGRPGGRREVLGSAFFNVICFQVFELRRILSLDPHRPLGTLREPFTIRDSFSPTVLARSLLETYLNFYYLCVDQVAEDTRNLRFAIWDWHDLDDRLRGAGESPAHDKEFREFDDGRRKLRATIESLPAWATLSKEHRRRAFEEGRAIIKPKAAIAADAGISGEYYRMIYTFLSTYSHGAPLATSHSLALGEGGQQAIAMQWDFLTRQFDITLWLASFVVRDILRLFPDAEVKVHRRVWELVETWEEILLNWGRRDRDGK